MDSNYSNEDKYNDQIVLRIFLYFFLYPGENKEIRNMVSHSFDFFDYREDEYHFKDPMGLKKVIVDMMKKYEIKSYLDFALNIAKLPKQLFDESTEKSKRRIQSFDRAALITYSFCLAKPTLHSSAYVLRDDETGKIYKNKWNETNQVPTEFINFCKEKKLSTWLLELRNINFRDFLEANESRISFGFDQCVEIENKQMSSPEMMEIEQSGYYNTIKHFYKYCREKIKNKVKQQDEEDEEEDEEGEDEYEDENTFEDSEEGEEDDYVEGFSWEDISTRLSGFRLLERNYPFLVDSIKVLFNFPFFKEFHEFSQLYKSSNLQNKTFSSPNKKISLKKIEENISNQNIQNIVDLFTVFNRNSRIEECLVNDPLLNKQNEEIDRFISSQKKIEQDSTDALLYFQNLTPKEKDHWMNIAYKWSLYKNGQMVKKDSLICWNYFGKRSCKNNDCMFLHILRPHNIPNMKEKCDEINLLFKNNSRTKFCVDSFLGKTCKNHSNCLDSVKLNDLSPNDQSYLRKWFRICWNFIFGQCNSDDQDCSFSHKLYAHNLKEENQDMLSNINLNLNNLLCLKNFKFPHSCGGECQESHHLNISQLSKYDQEYFLSWQNICWPFILDKSCQRGDHCKNLHEINESHFPNFINFKLDKFTESLFSKKLCLPFFQNRANCDIQKCCFEHFFSVSDMKKKHQMHFYKWQNVCWEYLFDRTCDVRFCRKTHNFQDFHLNNPEDVEKINEDLSKNKLCIRFFQDEICDKNCTLSHSLDLDMLTRQSYSFQNYKKGRLCWGWFFKGKCTSGNCRLDHQLRIEHFNFSCQEKVIEKNKKFRSYVQDYKKGICKVVLTSGNCNPEQCRFYHPQHLNLRFFSQTNQYHYKMEK